MHKCSKEFKVIVLFHKGNGFFSQKCPYVLKGNTFFSQKCPQVRKGNHVNCPYVLKGMVSFLRNALNLKGNAFLIADMSSSEMSCIPLKCPRLKGNTCVFTEIFCFSRKYLLCFRNVHMCSRDIPVFTLKYPLPLKPIISVPYNPLCLSRNHPLIFANFFLPHSKPPATLPLTVFVRRQIAKHRLNLSGS